MGSIRNILVAIKDTTTPSPALAKAAQLARAFGARLELFHGIATPVYADAYVFEASALRSLARRRRAGCLAELDNLAQPLRSEDLTVTVSADWDYPVAEAIVRRAKRIKADLIVAEPHAGRHIAPVLLHLTDWELLRLSPIPVLLIKSRHLYRRPVIVAAVDPTHALAKPAQLDAEILRAGSGVAEALHGTLHALHCFSASPMIPMSADAMSAELLQTLEADAREHSRAAFDRLLERSGIPPRRRHLAAGHPVVAIPESARQLGSAIMVMGAVSRSGLKRFFIGNTAERVLDQTPCDILVVKPPQFVTHVSRDRRGMHLVAGARLPMPY
jgi:universal stress protein E